MDAHTLTITGMLAGILILSGWVQQIIKGYKTKSLKDVSIYLITLIAAGAVLWLVYGIEVHDGFIVGTNIAAIILMVIVIVMKRKYDKNTQLKQRQQKEEAGGVEPPQNNDESAKLDVK